MPSISTSKRSALCSQTHGVAKGGTKARILTAASRLFLEGGVKALSVRAISQRAGLSTIGIYSHFQGKQGILDALYIEGFEKVYKTVDQDMSSVSPREAALRAASDYLDMAEAYQAHYRLIFGESQPEYQPSQEAYLEGAKAFDRLTELVGTLFPQNVRKLARQKAALQLWALLHGYASLRHNDISLYVQIKDWKALALQAVQLHIDAREADMAPLVK